MVMKVVFSGGPRDGQSKDYEKDPKLVACVTEAHAKGCRCILSTGLMAPMFLF